MTLISASNLGKEFAGQICFRQVDCSLQPGDRIGLIGANGTGKSTLLHILQGTLDHEGSVSRRRGLRIALLDQNPELPEGMSARRTVLSGHERATGLLRQREEIHESLARPGLAAEETERLLRRLSSIESEVEREGADLLDQRVERILDGIGFPRDRIDRQVDDLSGGERNRVAIGRLLLTEPDVFLLDEPTNHLDLDGIAFLTRFLQETAAGVILVSHDRRFLDETTTQTWQLEGEKLWIYPAPYSRAKVLREERVANERQVFERQQEFLQKQEQFIRRYKAGQRARQAKGRLRRLERVERLQRPEEQARSMILRLPMKTPPGTNVVELEEVTMGFGERVLFRDLSIEIRAGETLGIIGANGTGKTTLLRLLTEELQPFAGRFRWGGRVERGILSQHEVFPDPDLTPFRYLHACHPKMTHQELRDLLAAMLFRGNEIEKPVRVLSGGEQKRLMLTRLILEGNNVLLLDEPTNHLDLQSRDAVELALSNYEGTMIVVSHDRFFLDLIADRILWIEEDGWHLTWGGYREAETARRRRRKAAAEEAVPERKAARKEAKIRPSRKPKSPFSHLKTGEIETRIIGLEERLYALQLKLGEPATAADAVKRGEVEEEIASIEGEKAALEEEYGRRES